MAKDSRSAAWSRFWKCTEGIIDDRSDSKPQRDLMASIVALQGMNIPISAIEEIVNLVHSAYEIGSEESK